MISGLSIDLSTFSRKLCSGRFPLPRSEGLLAPIFQVHNTTLISRNEQYSVSRFCISFSTRSTPTQREGGLPSQSSINRASQIFIAPSSPIEITIPTPARQRLD